MTGEMIALSALSELFSLTQAYSFISVLKFIDASASTDGAENESQYQAPQKACKCSVSRQ